MNYLLIKFFIKYDKTKFIMFYNKFVRKIM